jgi:hypothetical protein
MNARWMYVAAVTIGLLLVTLLPAQYTFAPRQHEDMEARLTVETAQHTAERGLAAVTLTLTISGPATLDVEPPRLGDAAAAWKEERLTSTRVVQDQRATWSQIIRLKQVKRGMEPVPDVAVRYRRGMDADWIEEKWIDILRKAREAVPPPPETQAPFSWLRRWGFALALAATALMVVFAWAMKRRERREAPLPIDQWALREIERLERSLPPGEVETYHTDLSDVVRRYVTERFGLHALQQTTTEFLDAAQQVPQVPAALLGELFARCDLAKFARASTSPGECRLTAELARELVRQTTPPAR